MLEQDKNEKRIRRHKITQEDFTPPEVLKLLLEQTQSKDYEGITKKIIDPSCGIGNILVEVLKHKLQKIEDINQLEKVLKTIYGVEIMADNVEECRNNIYNVVIDFFPEIKENKYLNNRIRTIIRNRIQWSDSLKFDYSSWPLLKFKSNNSYVDFKEIRSVDDINYPMWGKNILPRINQLELFSDKDFK